MRYDVFLWAESEAVLAEFPDCPGCQTFVAVDPAASEERTAAAIADASYEALNGWLEAHLASGQIPPRPASRTNAPEGKSLSKVPVRPGLAAAVAIRWARQDAGLTQKELGRRAGISQQQIQKLENPDENPTIATLDKVARALGLTVGVGFEREEFDARPALEAVRPLARARRQRPSQGQRTRTQRQRERAAR